jgi:exonuclease I
MKAILLNLFEFIYELINKKNLISVNGINVVQPILYITLQFAFIVLLKKRVIQTLHFVL